MSSKDKIQKRRTKTMSELVTLSFSSKFKPPLTPRSSLGHFKSNIEDKTKKNQPSISNVLTEFKNSVLGNLTPKPGNMASAKILPELTDDKLNPEDSQKLIKVPPFILLPDSMPRMIWDFLILLLVLLYACNVPLEVGFDVQMFSDNVEAFFNMLFIFDIVLNFRTAYKYRGIIVYDWKKIGSNYLRLWFWIDLIAIIPLDIFFANTNATNINKIIRLVRIIKLFRVFRVARILKRFEDFSKLNPSVIRLLKMFSLALFVWHWIASAYWFLSDLSGFGFPNKNLLSEEELNYIFSNNTLRTETYADLVEQSMIFEAYARDGGNLWVPPPELWCTEVYKIQCNETMFEDFAAEKGYNPFEGVDYCFRAGLCPSSLSRKYVHCFFWAVMVTTGIGRDIMPVTPSEHIFSTVIIVVGVFMYAFIIGSASNSLSNWDAEKAEKRRKLETINTYLRQRNIPLALQKRIRAFYDYMWSSLQNINTKDGVLADLHETLSLELQICLYRKLVEKIPLFTIIKKSECVIDMIEKLQSKIYIPGEYILLQGEVGTEMFVIIRGTVCKLLQNRKTRVIKQTGTLSDGKAVGENALLYRCRREYSLRAATYCDVLILSKMGFDQVLKNYPEFRGTIYKMAVDQATGWERVRTMIRMTKTLSMLGNKQNMEDILLKSKPKPTPVEVSEDDKLAIKSTTRSQRRRRFSFVKQ